MRDTHRHFPEHRTPPAVQANVIVDVKEALSRNTGDSLVDQLTRLDGVRQARVSAAAPRLVIVDFDSMRVDAHHILGLVARCGFDARLVGM